MRRNSRDKTLTGRKKPGLQWTHCSPSMDKPPPGIAMDLEIIDSWDVTVLVDNVMDILSTTSHSVTGHIPNVFKAGATELSGKCLCSAHWGLSLVITAR